MSGNWIAVRLRALVLLVFAGLLLYAGWRGTWLPLQLTLAAMVLRMAWHRAPVLLAALLLWPDQPGD